MTPYLCGKNNLKVNFSKNHDDTKRKKKPINTEFYIQQTSFREIKIFSDEGKLREYVAS